MSSATTVTGDAADTAFTYQVFVWTRACVSDRLYTLRGMQILRSELHVS
jgi:hypothetical protein